MNSNLQEKLKECEREQNSLFSDTCEKCRVVYKLQECYFETNNLERWESKHSCDYCGLRWITFYYRRKEAKITRKDLEEEFERLKKKFKEQN